jgi:5-oxoprolinase (ATP-hydrolysing)
VAEGFVRIAVENMANAIKQISIARGHDVTRYTLQCFGGAGGQHACLVADALGIARVMIHPLAGVLSAYGMGLAHRVELRQRSLGGEALEPVLAELEAEAVAALRGQGVADLSVIRRAALRYEGSDTALEVPVGPDMGAQYVEAHQARFGFGSDAPVVVETAIVEAVEQGKTNLPFVSSEVETPAGERFSTSLEASGPVDRDSLHPGDRIAGPVIIIDETATTVVEPGWQAEVDAQANLILTRSVPRQAAPALGTEADPVMLEVMGNLFMAIAEEMGVALQNTASSVNIKERLDFSCAIFDAEGALIANAPHIPVHLGSMGDSIRTIIEARGERGTGAA